MTKQSQVISMDNKDLHKPSTKKANNKFSKVDFVAKKTDRQTTTTIAKPTKLKHMCNECCYREIPNGGTYFSQKRIPFIQKPRV